MSGTLALLGVIIVGFFGYALWFSSDQNDRLEGAERKAHAICDERGGALTFDVHNQARMVYACQDDMRLHVIDYGSAGIR